MPIRLVIDEQEIARCAPVLIELRPHLSVDELADLLARLRAEGAAIAALEDETGIATVAVFRVRTMLATGLTMYVDDLVTASQHRSKGHGKAMLEWLMNYARQCGCDTFSLDSGTFRHEAHAFYFREGLRITSFHFASKL